MPRSLELILRSALGVAAAAGTLLAGAWAGGALQPARASAGRAPRATTEEAQAYPRRSAEPPASPQGTRARNDLGDEPAGAEIPLGDALNVNGQPMQISLFTTQDGPEKVIAFYRGAFEKRGLVPITDGNKSGGHVSVFDPDDGMQRFINALPQAGGETLVMVGITNPRRPPRFLRTAAAAPFPVPDEHRGFLAYSSDDGGARAQNGQFVTSLSVAAVQEFYRKQLKAQGYAERPDSSGALLVFDKPGVSLSVAVQALDDKAGAAVFVNRLEGGGQ